MADDWVRKYMESWQPDDRAIKDSPTEKYLQLFREISDRCKKDVSEFCGIAGEVELNFRFVPSKSFVVSRSKFPSASLSVELAEQLIAYDFSTKFDKDTPEEKTHGQFVITDDRRKRLQVKRNGDYFRDESEISEVLLRPVFDYLKGNL